MDIALFKLTASQIRPVNPPAKEAGPRQVQRQAGWLILGGVGLASKGLQTTWPWNVDGFGDVFGV
jgi:hypothetical protein